MEAQRAYARGEVERQGATGCGQGEQVGGIGYWRLEMRLGLVLGYGTAFGVESGPECWGGRAPPPLLGAIPWLRVIS